MGEKRFQIEAKDRDGMLVEACEGGLSLIMRVAAEMVALVGRRGEMTITVRPKSDCAK